MTNVVNFPERPQPADPVPPREPMFRVPPVTGAFVVLIIAMQAVLMFALSPPDRFTVFTRYGFVPADYAGAFSPHLFLTPFTYMLLHGGWAHVAVNALMLTAFGTGLERMIGGRRMIVLFVLTGLAAAGAHFLIAPSSTDPVIGASGGISGLFGAVIVLMQRAQGGGNWRRLLPLALVWIAVSALSGFIGGPGGENVAWIAHIGGFIAGLILIRPVLRLPI